VDITTKTALAALAGRSWFWFNLGGIDYSQPNRLEVACQYGAAVVTDQIYAEWAEHFPAFHISADTEMGGVQTFSIKEELQYLNDHYEEIYKELWRDQEIACRRLFHPRNWLHFMLATLPNQPLKHALDFDEDIPYYYNN
jgi:hypothetical protein